VLDSAKERSENHHTRLNVAPANQCRPSLQQKVFRYLAGGSSSECTATHSSFLQAKDEEYMTSEDIERHYHVFVASDSGKIYTFSPRNIQQSFGQLASFNGTITDMKLDPQSQTILVTIGGEVYGQRYRIEQGTALLSTPKTSAGGLDKMPSERRLRISEMWTQPEKLYPFNDTSAGNKTLTSLALDPRRQVIYAIDPTNSQILMIPYTQFIYKDTTPLI
jgi:hypothetical protein